MQESFLRKNIAPLTRKGSCVNNKEERKEGREKEREKIALITQIVKAVWQWMVNVKTAENSAMIYKNIPVP